MNFPNILDRETRNAPLPRTLGVATGAIASAAALGFGATQPASAQTCTPLRVVEGRGQTEVTKTVSPPSTPLSRSNWNTDFAVPRGVNYDYFVADVESESTDDGEFSIVMNLKYNDGGFDRIYEGERVPLAAGDDLNLTGNPRNDQQPYQVNVKVGGPFALGMTYSVSVVGCR